MRNGQGAISFLPFLFL